MSILTAGGFIPKEEAFCHFCGNTEYGKLKGFSVYRCDRCNKFYTACSYNILCQRNCLTCQKKQKVPPFDMAYHNSVDKNPI